MTRIPSVPLVTNDPYFSLWSPADRLYDCDTQHWCGKTKPMRGIVSIDGTKYRFMGKGSEEVLEQKDLIINPTSSVYIFENHGIRLEVKFTSPLLLHDLDLVSRPCTYIDADVISTDGGKHDVKLYLSFDERICHDAEEKDKMLGALGETSSIQYAWMGRSKQSPLNHTGDHITIDWGYLYIASGKNQNISLRYNAFENEDYNTLSAEINFAEVLDKQSAYIITAYDDTASIMYFGNAAKAYWTRDNGNIIEAVERSCVQHMAIIKKCEVFDAELKKSAYDKAGAEYELLCSVSYRQTIAAHKLILDENGEIIFLSKECDSNGCIGTVDVSYPSVPLYLMYNTEYVKGMLRPIFRFAKLPVWNYDFAPHDVGRYPYANGQVYGLNEEFRNGLNIKNGDVFPPVYQYPEGSDIYDLKYQMPVEECGNMLIMSAVVTSLDDNADFILPHMELLEKWVCYLLEYGQDPGEQLCTDDFAGHLAHNVNLSAKAIMGIASYGLILKKLGRSQEARGYMEKAAEMAKTWEAMAAVDGHTALTYEDKGGWSLKYNIVWDLLFRTNLFSKSVFENEIQWYKKMQNKYGVPLDSRETYTKSDWILWCAAMTDNKEDMAELIKPICDYLAESESRVPFSDWYDTSSGSYVHFMNRTVQGGIFMPLFAGYLS